MACHGSVGVARVLVFVDPWVPWVDEPVPAEQVAFRASVNPKADEDQPFKTLRDNAADNAKVVPFNGNDKTVDSLCTAVFDNKLYTDGSDHDLGNKFYVHNPDRSRSRWICPS